MIEHFFEALPGPDWFNARDIYAEAVGSAASGAVFVELGAWKGRSTAFMAVEIANSGKQIEFYAIDLWLGSPGEPQHRSDPDVLNGTLHETFLRNLEGARDYVVPMRCDSVEAAARFEDDSVDFLFADTEHNFDQVAAELAVWWPKIKHGGTVAGDDWNAEETSGRLGVRDAVHGFCRAHGQRLFLRPGNPDRDYYRWQFRKERG